MDVENLSDEIAPLDESAMKRARDWWNSVAKPIGSLGRLEDIVVQIAGLTGNEDVRIDKRIVAVLCADNGVVAQGVTQSQPDITTVVAGSVAKGTSSVCTMSKPAGIDSISVDMGMLTPSDVEGVLDCHVARGTGDISNGPAMTRDQAEQAIREGIQLVGMLKDKGYQLIATGEMGIGNTTTSSAMAAVFLGLPVEEVTGKGAGLSDAGLQRKIDAITRAIEVNDPDAKDALDVLSKLGGFDIAGLVGVLIGGALHRVPIVIDGFISILAAYTAVSICPACRVAMLPSHISAEPAARLLAESLDLHPILHAQMRLGEGTGAICLVPLIDMALSLYRGTTFDQAGIEAYDPDLH